MDMSGTQKGWFQVPELCYLACHWMCPCGARWLYKGELRRKVSETSVLSVLSILSNLSYLSDLSICLSDCLSISISIFIPISIYNIYYIYLYLCIVSMGLSIYLSVCMYVYFYIYIYIYIHVHAIMYIIYLIYPMSSMFGICLLTYTPNMIQCMYINTMY